MRTRIAAALLLAGLATSACEPERPPDLQPGVELPPCDWGTVVSVTDGDTIRVLIDGEDDDVPVRYIGIDTPELNGPDGRELLAEDARAINADLVDDDRICLERDVSDTDRFGRLLRHPWLGDGRLVSEELVREGLAEVVEFPPDLKYHESRLYPAQAEAQRERLRLWER